MAKTVDFPAAGVKSTALLRAGRNFGAQKLPERGRRGRWRWGKSRINTCSLTEFSLRVRAVSGTVRGLISSSDLLGGGANQLSLLPREGAFHNLTPDNTHRALSLSSGPGWALG